MNARSIAAFLVIAAGSAGGLPTAHAGPGTGPLHVGAEAQVLPLGELADSVGDVDLVTSFAIAGLVDYAVHPNLHIGAAPRVIIGVRADDDDDDTEESSTQLDLAVRFTGRLPVSAGVDFLGYQAPGYSIFFLDEDANFYGVDDPTGFILGLGGGAAVKVTPTLSVIGELGYTFGFQGTSGGVSDGDGGDPDGGGVVSKASRDAFQTRFLHVGIGVQAAL
jgi:hypothetical protein